MLTFLEWKELRYGKDYKHAKDENGICDGSCDSCLQSVYMDYVRSFNNK